MVRYGVSYCSQGIRIPRLHPSSNTKQLKIWIILAKKVLSSYSKNRKTDWNWPWVPLIIIEMIEWNFVHNRWLVHTSEIYVGHVDLCISTSVIFSSLGDSQDKFKMWKTDWQSTKQHFKVPLLMNKYTFTFS